MTDRIKVIASIIYVSVYLGTIEANPQINIYVQIAVSIIEESKNNNNITKENFSELKRDLSIDLKVPMFCQAKSMKIEL